MLLWLEQTESDVPAGDSWLSPAEAGVLAGFRFPKRRADWRLGRWTAKRALAAYLGAPLPDIEIRATPEGSPEAFRAGAPLPLVISISHREGRSCCAIADSHVKLGCDLEWIEPHSAAFAADYFTPDEQRLVAEAAPADRHLFLTLLWSAKESALKALRIGLHADTRSVDVTIPRLPARRGWQPFCANFEAFQFNGWWQVADPWVRTVVTAPGQTPPEWISPSVR